MKKIILLLIYLFLIKSVSAIDLNLNSQNYYVYNLTEDKVMYESNSNERIKIASLTKIVTAIIAIENNEDLSEEVIISSNDYKDYPEYATAGFKIGQIVTKEDLLYGVLLKSGSEAVNAIVRTTTTTEEDFVKLMNFKVKELGLENTYFSNPIGKDEGNYSTLMDMSKLLEYCLKNDKFKEIFSTLEYQVGNLVFEGPLSRINSSLINGAKTGYTSGAMYCLISFSEVGDCDYITVTSGASSYLMSFNDNKKIYDHFINNYGYKDYNIEFDILIENGKKEVYSVNLNTSLYLENNYNKDNLNHEYSGITKITKDMVKGDILGKVSIYYENELLKEIDVFLNEDLKYKINYMYIILPCFLFFIISMLIIIFIKLCKKKLYKKFKSVNYMI